MYRKPSTQGWTELVIFKAKELLQPQPQAKKPEELRTLLHKHCITGNNNQGVQSKASCGLTRTGDYSSACE